MNPWLVLAGFLAGVVAPVIVGQRLHIRRLEDTTAAPLSHVIPRPRPYNQEEEG